MKKIISDLYPCIQGEGMYSGVPHVLVRLIGCNLHCAFSDGICDSAHASWKPEYGKYDANDVVKMLDQNPQIYHILITGGNPTNNISGLQEIISSIRNMYGYHLISLEDNGTQFPEKDYLDIDFVTLSPKLKNSIPIIGKKYIIGEQTIELDKEAVNSHKNHIQNHNSLKKWMKTYDYQMKFVVSTESQITEIAELQKSLGVPYSKIYLMPEGSNREQLEKRRVWLMETCIKTGYNYTDRLHIVAYDTRRDV